VTLHRRKRQSAQDRHSVQDVVNAANAESTP